MDLEEKILSTLTKNKTERIRIAEKNLIKEQNLFYLTNDSYFDFVKERLIKLLDLFKESFEIKELKPLNHKSNNSEYFYGMIVNYDKEKLNSNNVTLFNNIDDSNSLPVKIDLRHLSHYSIFPGQVVVVKGRNVNGDLIVVENIECLGIIEMNDVAKEIVIGKPIKIITCSSPFYDEINEFTVLDKILTEDVDVIILHGPLFEFDINKRFIDAKEFYNKEVYPKLNTWLKRDTSSLIILIPSLEDLVSFNVFPQAPYYFTETNKRILCYSNPSSFYVNGFLFSTISTDIFLNLTSEEFYSSYSNPFQGISNELLFKTDRLGRLCYHLIFQQSFLPVFPPDFPISLSNLAAFEMDIAPDFLILSSKVKEFYKEVDPTRIINHGVQKNINYKYFSAITITNEKDITVKLEKLFK